MRKIWFLVIFAIALGGLYVINSDYGSIKVRVMPFGGTPRQYYTGPIGVDPNLNLIPEELRDVRFSYVYVGQWSLEGISEYRKKHSQEPAIISSSSGSYHPGTTTTVFSNNPNPDLEFFRL